MFKCNLECTSTQAKNWACLVDKILVFKFSLKAMMRKIDFFKASRYSRTGRLVRHGFSILIHLERGHVTISIGALEIVQKFLVAVSEIRRKNDDHPRLAQGWNIESYREELREIAVTWFLIKFIGTFNVNFLNLKLGVKKKSPARL